MASQQESICPRTWAPTYGEKGRPHASHDRELAPTPAAPRPRILKQLVHQLTAARPPVHRATLNFYPCFPTNYRCTAPVNKTFTPINAGDDHTVYTALYSSRRGVSFWSVGSRTNIVAISSLFRVQGPNTATRLPI
ncbi:hypothetical protein J6590_006479 [Homalodisca vitripennis]|nr:hypothetical protein J6590_006479 [Homalodisca vitripennis]